MRLSLVAPACLALGALPAQAETGVPVPPHIENFFILGVGFGPQYLGSDDTITAAAPAARFDLAQGRSATLIANLLTLDLAADTNWQIGPAAILRLGRGDVDNQQVAALPDIDMALDVGLSLGYEWRGSDLRDRWKITSGVLIDTTGDFTAQTAWGGVQRWQPVGQYGALGLSLGATWGSGDYMDTYFSVDPGGSGASGLPIFDAQSGARDLRVAAVYVQPISPKWAIGAGVLYSRLLGDAQDSPISQSDEQIYGGIGLAYAW